MPQTEPSDSKSQSRGAGAMGPRGARVAAAAYYPSPFQKHYDQLGKLVFDFVDKFFPS